MEISGANAIITHVVEKEQCTVKRILSHRQHTDGSGAPTRGYRYYRSEYMYVRAFYRYDTTTGMWANAIQTS